jgi:hypothetical protein
LVMIFVAMWIRVLRVLLWLVHYLFDAVDCGVQLFAGFACKNIGKPQSKVFLYQVEQRFQVRVAGLNDPPAKWSRSRRGPQGHSARRGGPGGPWEGMGARGHWGTACGAKKVPLGVQHRMQREPGTCGG